jgi:hypothetical protein
MFHSKIFATLPRSLQEGKEDGPEIVSDAKETFSRGWALIAEF